MEFGASHTRECANTFEKPDCVGMVERIRSGDPSGMEELYEIFGNGLRYYLYRHLGPQDLDDKVHDILLIITQSIRRGDLREPDRLMGYARTIAQRQVAAQIENNVQGRRGRVLDYNIRLSDHEPTSEARIIDQERVDVAMRVLKGLNRRDREVLTRFYLKEESAEQIRREMRLSETQFRLIKSRAKARFAELGKRRLSFRKATSSVVATPTGILRRSA